MAQVTTKKKDSKYSHLSRVYSDGLKQEKISSGSIDKLTFNVKIPLKEKTIERKELVRDALLIIALGVLASSGYLIARFAV